MKKLIVLYIFLLIGCASYDLQQAMRPNNRFLAKKLPNMEAIFETGKSLDTGVASIQSNSEFSTLFRREVENNLIETDGPIKGKLVLDPVYFEVDQNNAWLFTLYPLLFIPPSLGVPLYSNTSKWELELNVIDKSGKRIARYSSEAMDTEYYAAYWGYDNSYTAAAFEGYKKALNSVIEQLQNDIPVLSSKLK